MEERKTIFDYMAQTVTCFGVSILSLTVFCQLFGESAIGYSSIFQLGSQGISCSTISQFLAVSVIITGIRYVCFTDRFIKKMPIVWRAIVMASLIIGTMAAFSYVFAWFPIGMWEAWCMFFISFFVSFFVSVVISGLKEKAENRALERALKKMQEDKEAGQDGE